MMTMMMMDMHTEDNDNHDGDGDGEDDDDDEIMMSPFLLCRNMVQMGPRRAKAFRVGLTLKSMAQPQESRALVCSI